MSKIDKPRRQAGRPTAAATAMCLCAGALLLAACSSGGSYDSGGGSGLEAFVTGAALGLEVMNAVSGDGGYSGGYGYSTGYDYSDGGGGAYASGGGSGCQELYDNAQICYQRWQNIGGGDSGQAGSFRDCYDMYMDAYNMCTQY
jgi:hypothetical protein